MAKSRKLISRSYYNYYWIVSRGLDVLYRMKGELEIDKHFDRWSRHTNSWDDGETVSLPANWASYPHDEQLKRFPKSFF